MSQSTTGERVTAAISTVVAIAILGAAVTAQQSRTPIADRLASLESDLRFQFDLAYRDDHGALQSHLGELELTLDAWRKSPQSSDDVQLLVDWLRTSIERTMPGRSGELPPLPPFGRQRPIIVATNPHPPAAPPEPTPTPELAPSEPAVEGTELPVDEPAIELAATATPPAEAASEARGEPPAPTTPSEHSIAMEPVPEIPAVAIEEVPAPAAPAEPSPTVSAPPPRRGVSLNLAELNARITGYHDGLAEIDAGLIMRPTLNGRRLAGLVGKIEWLAGQYKFVRLYYDALTPAERRFVPAPRSMSETVARVNERVAAATTGDDFLEDFDAAHADKPTLAQRLHAVTEAVSAGGDATR